jgi:hypothetical protein
VNFALSLSTARAVIAWMASILSANWSTRNVATEEDFCPARDATATGVEHFGLLVGVENRFPEGCLEPWRVANGDFAGLLPPVRDA